MSADITFRDLESHIVQEASSDSLSALEVWYESVRDLPISEFAIEDVCRSVRQELFLPYVVPEAIARLSGDVLAGYKYDGELLVALSNIPITYWVSSPTEAEKVARIIGTTTDQIDEDLLPDVARLNERIAKARPA